jgi:hypothetical protein
MGQPARAILRTRNATSRDSSRNRRRRTLTYLIWLILLVREPRIGQ